MALYKDAWLCIIAMVDIITIMRLTALACN